MTMSIRNNKAALIARHNTEKSDALLDMSLSRLSSGSKITRLSDNPTDAAIAERLRADIVSRHQALQNTELAVSMIQTADAALEEMNTMLISLRTLGIQASNELATNPEMLAAAQAEVDELLESMEAVGERMTYLSNQLLNGDHGMRTRVVGKNLEYVSSGEKTRTSPSGGYAVDIISPASRSRLFSQRAVEDEEITKGGIKLSVEENGKFVSVTSDKGESFQRLTERFNEQARQNNVPVVATAYESGDLLLEHNEYGSASDFQAFVSLPDFFVPGEPIAPTQASGGKDVVATIGAHKAIGKGQYLRGAPGTETEGLVLRYTGTDAPVSGDEFTDESVQERAVIVENNSLVFQVGPDGKQIERMALPNVLPENLGLRLENKSGFKSLADVRVTDFQGAQDTILFAQKVTDELTEARGRLGSFQKHSLTQSENHLRKTMFDLADVESKIKDTDMAFEFANLTKQQLAEETAAKMLKRATDSQKSIISLVS